MLPPSNALLLEHHLRLCPECRSIADALGVCDLLLPELATADPGPEFVDSVLERTSRLPLRPSQSFDFAFRFLRSLFFRPRFALEAAYIGALLLFGLYGLLPGTSVQPALLQAGPTPVELCETATEYVTANLGTLFEQSGRLRNFAGTCLKSAGETADHCATVTIVGLENDYRRVREWTLGILEEAQLHIEQAWHGPEINPES